MQLLINAPQDLIPICADVAIKNLERIRGTSMPHPYLHRDPHFRGLIFACWQQDFNYTIKVLPEPLPGSLPPQEACK